MTPDRYAPYMAYEFNTDRTRAISDEAVFGIAAYVGEVENGQFTGRHAGIFPDLAQARAWLRGENMQPLIVYGADRA